MPKYSIKEPIQNYKIPKTDDIIAVSFLSNWLNHRRQQLYNNIADTRTYTVDKATGRPATAGHLGYLNYLRGYSPERIETNSNFYTQIANGSVRFLISEQEAKTKLLGTKIGQKMKPAERLVRLAPHIETTKLFDEICNLRIKNTGNNTVVEQISSKINKDRFSAAEYALWRIKIDEDEYFRKRRYKAKSLKNFMLFTKR